jgi:hypothetical protein
MVTVSWQSYKEADPSKTYLAYGALAERKTVWSFFSFLMRARKVQKQLETSRGVVGFTARLEFLSKKVVQLAVFDDANTLKEFSQTGQHVLCSEQTKASMKWLKNKTWSISGSEIPPKIEDAINKNQS